MVCAVAKKVFLFKNFFKDNLNLKTIAYLVISLQRLHLRKNSLPMFWTLELASYLEEAPWPASKDELIDYAIRSGAPIEVVENLQELEDEVFFGECGIAGEIPVARDIAQLVRRFGFQFGDVHCHVHVYQSLIGTAARRR